MPWCRFPVISVTLHHYISREKVNCQFSYDPDMWRRFICFQNFILLTMRNLRCPRKAFSVWKSCAFVRCLQGVLSFWKVSPPLRPFSGHKWLVVRNGSHECVIFRRSYVKTGQLLRHVQTAFSAVDRTIVCSSDRTEVAIESRLLLSRVGLLQICTASTKHLSTSMIVDALAGLTNRWVKEWRKDWMPIWRSGVTDV